MKKITGSRDIIREQIRKRDKHTCRMCGKVWKEGQRRFDVHHKDFDPKKTREVNHLKKEIRNMITLCHECHALQHKEERKKRITFNPYAQKLGRLGGQAVLKKYGKKHFKEIRANRTHFKKQ